MTPVVSSAVNEVIVNKQALGYWITTVLFCLAMGGGGVLNLIRFEGQQQAMSALGYPDYLMSILGVAKVLGVIALVIPKVPLLKEWAYAGFTFDLLGAAASHAFVEHAIQGLIPPIFLLGIMSLSYWCRPPDRRLAFAAATDVEKTR